MPESSPLARLVLCLVLLSVFATLVGGLHWLIVDKPQQERMVSPENSESMSCREACLADGEVCMSECPKIPPFVYGNCRATCMVQAEGCANKC